MMVIKTIRLRNLTNSFFCGNVSLMFTSKLVSELKKNYLSSSKAKRRGHRSDVVAEQVKKVLQTSDQQLILMVRG